jgi:hypothetical protein
MVRAGRVMVDVAFAPIVGKGTGERTLMHQILPRVKLQKALFLFDAGFYAFALLHGLNLFKHHFLIKWLRVLGRTEPPQIDQGVGHQLHSVVPMLDTLKPQQ